MQHIGDEFHNTLKEPAQVRALFEKMARKYDFANHLLSMGLDFTWRIRASKYLAPDVDGPIFDGATGTGDLAIEHARRYPDREIVGIDFTPGMIEIAKKKIRDLALHSRVRMEVGDLTSLSGFDAETFAAASISFGIRNVENRRAALSELRRILRPGGRLMIVEFSMPTVPIFAPVYRFYFRNIMPLVSIALGLGDTYGYLYRSVTQFPPRDRFCSMLGEAGFVDVRTKSMSLGTVTVYLSRKPV